MNRRDLIKSLAVSPLFLKRSFGASLLNSNFLQDPTASDVFILLHGLFFLEYVNKTLVVTAPEVSDHDYRLGEPDDIIGQQHEISGPNNSLDLSDSSKFGLIGDTTCTNRFPPELLQFSKGETGVGDLNGTFHFRRILPCPLDIIPLRKGNRSDFHGNHRKVHQSIESHAKGATQVSLVTCLRYAGMLSQIGPLTIRSHFYAEPDCEENAGIDHVNGALVAAQALFANGKQNFDLQLVPKKVPPVPALAPGKDDNRAAELPSDPIEEDPLFEIPKLCQQPSTNAQPPAAPGISQIIGGNVANCGQFGVIP